MTNTINSLVLDSLRGKYFQYILNPTIILSEVHSINSPRMGENEATFSAWDPLNKTFYHVPLGESHLYREISKEKFEKITELYNKGLEKEIEDDFDKGLLENNKTNLSSQKEEEVYGTPKSAIFINNMRNRDKKP